MTATQALPQRAPSRTPLLLRRMRAAMVILALLTGAAAGVVTVQQHAVVSSAGDHTATAVMQAYAAHQALADANDQAVRTIPLGLGPVGQYQDDIAGAEQNLERVAENNTAGAAGTTKLQLIEGLLPAYTGLVEQADARFQTNSESGAGREDLWEAVNLMLGQILTDGISKEKDSTRDLETVENGTLTGQQASPWVSPRLAVLWLLPAVALLLTLAATQRLLYRRSRRLLSKYLTMAAAAVIALCAVASHVIVLEHSFRMASGPLQTVVAAQKFRAANVDRDAGAMLAERIGGSCGSACSATLQELSALAGSEASLPEAACHDPACITTAQNTYTHDVGAAQAGYAVSLTLIAVLTVVLLLLIPVGLSRYLDEYRYRQA